MNIVVLSGGLSTERDVSFKSGDMVAQALRRKGHKALLLDVFMGYKDEDTDLTDIFERSEEASVKVANISSTAPDIPAVIASRDPKYQGFFGPNVIKLCQMADIVFMALHGADGENGKVQAAFDLYGIKYTGNGYLSSALAMDKGITKNYLKDSGVPFPKGYILQKSERTTTTEKPPIPCVVKLSCGGSSIGVFMCNSEEEYEAALDDAFNMEETVVVEEYVKGREFSCGVIKGKALPIIEIAPLQGFYDYKNKYAAGSTVETCPAELSPEKTTEMQRYAEMVFDGLGLEVYARMDFLMRENGEIFCLEANTLPGMTPTSLLPQEAQATGVGYDELCEKIIELSLQK